MQYNMKYEPTEIMYGKIDTIKPCPHCDHPPDPFRQSQCVLNKPLIMVITPQGIHLSCPAHPEGHHIFGPQVSL